MNDLLTAALEYAARDLAIFPCHSVTEGRCTCGCIDPACFTRGKHPRISDNLQNASADAAQIRTWWTRWPDANIGLACGPSGLVVIDIDPRKGGDETWHDFVAAHGPDLTATWTSLTGGGGVHYLFRAPVGVTLDEGTDKLGPGVDVKAAGGYVILPPSRHLSGRCYAWENDDAF